MVLKEVRYVSLGCEVGQYGNECRTCQGCQKCDIENGWCGMWTSIKLWKLFLKLTKFFSFLTHMVHDYSYFDKILVNYFFLLLTILFLYLLFIFVLFNCLAKVRFFQQK